MKPEDITQDDTIESLVAEVADEFLKCLNRGECPSIAEYQQRYPQISDVLEQVLPALQIMDSAVDAKSYVDAPAKGRLGDFEIICEIGRGGMGIVYEANQISLGRRVALKVLPFAAVLDDRQLHRFRVEAQTAAQLHHTNIVPIFSVGCERGVHYYAMQCVDGPNLGDVIGHLRQFDQMNALDSQIGGGNVMENTPDARPSASKPEQRSHGSSTFAAGFGLDETTTGVLNSITGGHSTKSPAFFRSVAKLGIQAADALEYAHTHGIVHRDIKPSNMLLDSSARLWITDFGLAQVKSEAGLTLTMPGDLLGTIRYMSPEQALGKKTILDHRTDIYSLGVTLYETLTMAPAFAGANRQQLLRKITDEEPVRLQKLNDAVPTDLETIVLKAMAKEPQSRYATANELSQDLQRFLEYKPIMAKRPSIAEMAMKWSRRHQPIVWSAVLILLLAVLAASVATVLIWRQQNEALREKMRAQANFQKARDAVDEMTRAAQEQLVNIPGTEKVRQDLLQKAQIFYREFVEEEISNDPSVRQEMGRAYKRLADIHQMLGEFEQSEQAFGQAIVIFEALSAEFPSAAEHRRDLASTLFWLGVLLKNYMADKHQALNVYERAFELRAELVDEFPTAPEYLSELAHSHVDLGLVLRDLWHYEEALPQFRQSLGLRAQLADRFPDNLEYREALAHSHHWLGACLQDVGQLEEAERHYRQCLALREELAKALPDSANCKHDLAHIQNYLGSLLLEMDRSEEALGVFQEAAAIGEQLVAGFPKFHVYWRRVIGSYEGLGEALAATGHSEQAEEKFRQCVSINQRLVSDCPGSRMYQSCLKSSYNHLGLFLQATDRLEEAEQAYRTSVEVCEKLVADVPEVPEYREALAKIYSNLGDVLEKMGRVDEARQAFQKAKEIEEQVLPEEEE